MPSIKASLGSNLSSVSYSIYNPNTKSTVASGTLPNSKAIDLTAGSTPGIDYRIYFYNGSLPLTGDPPDGMTSTAIPFSFVEYNFNNAGQISLDVSYINDWAYPIQISDGTNTYGLKDANGVVAQMTSKNYGDFFPKSASAAGNASIGNTADLYDPATKRFIGPLSIFTNQAKWAGWTHGELWTETNWAATAASSWMQFGSDVPFGAMPYGGAGSTSPGTGFAPSNNASTSSAAFPSGSLPPAPSSWPSWINGSGSPYGNYPQPQYGFDFSTTSPFYQANTNDASGESQTLPTNFAVWNLGYSKYEPSIPPGNIAPDSYPIAGKNYSNGYTAALRAQSASDGGQHLVDKKPKSGFFTFPIDNFNAEFNNYDPSSISLTIWPLATVTTLGTATNDVITGTSSDDVILGGDGGDAITGGGTTERSALSNGGKDTYLYYFASESKPSKRSRDKIFDFQREDKIDLSGFDADPQQAGRQAFSWIGNDSFSGKAGELRYTIRDRGALLQGNLDQDGKADFEVLLLGVNHLSAAQLLL